MPDSFYIFLSGGGGVGKSFLTNTLTQYLKRVLRYPGQLIDKQPSVLVTASTGKAAVGINGITLHSAFRLPIKTMGKCFQYKKPKDEIIHDMRNRYKYLKVLMIDEISMVGCQTFQHLDLAMQLIMSNSAPFGGVSVIAIGDLLQLPPVNQQGVYMCPKKGTYESFQGSIWQNLFYLHELTEIVRQSSDPEFAELLSRLREGDHTKNDIKIIKSLEQTDTSTWPESYVRLFLINYLVNKENEEALSSLESEIFVIRA